MCLNDPINQKYNFKPENDTSISELVKKNIAGQDKFIKGVYIIFFNRNECYIGQGQIISRIESHLRDKRFIGKQIEGLFIDTTDSDDNSRNNRISKEAYLHWLAEHLYRKVLLSKDDVSEANYKELIERKIRDNNKVLMFNFENGINPFGEEREFYFTLEDNAIKLFDETS